MAARGSGRASNACTLAYWHILVFSSGAHGNSLHMLEVWKVLYEARADVIVNGHDHDYERFAPQDPRGRKDPARGIRAFVVGTGGGGVHDSNASGRTAKSATTRPTASSA